MYSKSLVIAAIASLAAADFAGDASAVIETASLLSGLVAGWSSGDGLVGALAIQETYGPLSEAVAALEGTSGSVTTADITADNLSALATLSSTVAGLLDALTAKAADFAAVGASTIVQGDITQLSGPSESIVGNIYSVGSADCEAVSSLAGPVGSLSAAFASAAGAYSVGAPSFPELTCAGDSTEPSETTSAAEEPSSEETSSSEESAVVSKAPVESGSSNTTAPTAGTNGTNGTNVTVPDVTVSEVVTETVCTKAVCTGVASANVALRNGVAFGAVAAIAAALL